jgi:hypothetical protein
MTPLMLTLAIACSSNPRIREAPEPETQDTSIDTDDTDVAYHGPAFYPDGRGHSPLTPYVVEQLRDLAALNSELQPDVFMKIGASSTASTRTLACFATAPLELGNHQHLKQTLNLFLGGDAAGSTPFDRDTEAAVSGKTAGWAISGNPSPVEAEIAAISPSLSFIHYGTNDMQMGYSYGSAMPAYYENMAELMEILIDHGIVPIVASISHRGDSQAANYWVGAYNAVNRGLAQYHQVPFLDMHLALDPLPGHGLSGDGIHVNGYSGGACVLTAEALEYGYNMRNLISVEALDRLKQVLLDGVDDLDEPGKPLEGDGSPTDPFTIAALPFTDIRDTSTSTHRNLDLYSGCSSDSNESGPEFLYRYEVEEAQAIRALVMDLGDADIDIHLLDATGSESGCIERGHRFIETTLQPGTYIFALDSWVDGGGDERSGEFIFALIACDEGDSDCD